MKKRVLLVDDEEAFTRMMRLNLEATGKYEVREENFGWKAVEVARVFRPHVVLLDIIMPQEFGGNVAAEFANDPQVKDVPIVFLTAAVTPPRVREHEGVIGGRPILAKPASLESVVEAIEKYARNTD